jgi:transposase-like protein
MIGIPRDGDRHSLWRAVDQGGNSLDILVQRRHGQQAAQQFLRKSLKGLTYMPWAFTTDKPASYGAARQEVLPNTEGIIPQLACTGKYATHPEVLFQDENVSLKLSER